MPLILTLAFQTVLFVIIIKNIVTVSDEIPAEEHNRVAVMISLAIGFVTALSYGIAHAIAGGN